MRILFIGIFLILVSLISTQEKNLLIHNDINKNIYPNDEIRERILKQCSSTQINAFYAAIAKYQTMNQAITAYHIRDHLQTNIKQDWNVFVCTTPNNCSVSYYPLNGCQIRLNNYGRFNRTYIGWRNNNTSPIPCPQQRKIQINTTIVLNCNNQTISEATQCVKNKLKSDFNESWNAFGRQFVAGAMLAPFQAGQKCMQLVEMQSDGRNFLVYKAV